MYIGKAAQLSGTTVKSIRHYEEIGLLPPPQREGKYRIYSQQDRVPGSGVTEPAEGALRAKEV
ncbi:MerR family DNA-binding transcriptional regulator, partial [Pseudomonas sp. YNh]|uniref:MerR family DNA-binding transcriptional regulator n=1 Tax=Pseudomonas sp. YNh TaxID=3133145 RepID=UPI0030F23406